MYGSQGVQAYAQVDLQSRVQSASPHQLITMLFDGAHSALVRARILMENGDIAGRGQAITKAINIIDNGLRASLDHEKGGEISLDLEQLYNYMTRRLMQANLHNEIDTLLHVDELLMGISDAWKQIAPN
ncbi:MULTISPECIES: flagellar export chaperone FliS [Tenebrionibacter/Tenebrionicola group]|jgi:flagellar protein FliS|uniref:Flagellar secretion chaperone FliS n=2 Tax=Tenebrionibacter/Tenebrionicola group TaxID=2969848 RepID=A0A8K0V1T5_9ENTR|nr:MULTISPECIES: flagellar export chaperone FliS [Tenebrionibacter/Tenebrionicola group]MBK4715432.1 flagellar export chaperone FliS [Tenebrionibacter intestinalis]MBV5096100.1 flagellar export chaperone FliS [Tenebrionicola larvae]